MRKNLKTITSIFQKWLFLIVAVTFAVSLSFSWTLQTKMSEENAWRLLHLNVIDVKQDVLDASDKNLLDLTKNIASILNRQKGDITTSLLIDLMKQFNVSEINLINEDGIIAESSYPAYKGFNMSSGEQSREFMCLLDSGEISYVQSYQPITYDSRLSRKYAGVVLKQGGFVQVSYNGTQLQKDIDQQVKGITRNRHVGENGCVIIANENGVIVSDRFQNEGKNLNVTGIQIDRETMPEEQMFTAVVYGEPSFVMYLFTEGYYIISVMPKNEIVLSRDLSVLFTGLMYLLVFLTLFTMIIVLVRKIVVENINSVNNSLAKITSGNLEEVVNVRDNVEFSSLSDDINTTVSALKRYIAEAAARIDQELEIARAIQLSALPGNFEKFSENRNFEIYASMDPAKEVGGDFYDFFFIDDNHLALLIADVSGKGIPGAMFMMTAKTLIKNRAMLGDTPAVILADVNDELCGGNDADMFVTVWLAILDLSTGKGMVANAGHEHPAIRRAGGNYELSVYLHSPAVAVMEGMHFREHAFELGAGDSLFVYTDGVPEATNDQEKAFGNVRMLAALNKDPDADPEELLWNVHQEIDAFVGDAPQFDDLTMMGFRFLGTEKKQDHPDEDH